MTDTQQPADMPIEIPQVDEAAVRKKSVLSGMWSGLKRGLLWGGVGGLGVAGIGTAISLAGAKMGIGVAANAAGTAAGWVPWLATKWPIGTALAAGITGVLGVAGYKGLAAGAAAVASPASTALGVLTAYVGAIIPVLAVTLAAGAVIGAVAGAINGYSDADNKVEQAHRAAKAQAQQLAFERQQVQKAILQEREMEAQLSRQTEQLYAGSAPQIGNLSPNAPHQKTHDPRLRGFENPVG